MTSGLFTSNLVIKVGILKTVILILNKGVVALLMFLVVFRLAAMGVFYTLRLVETLMLQISKQENKLNLNLALLRTKSDIKWV